MMPRLIFSEPKPPKRKAKILKLEDPEPPEDEEEVEDDGEFSDEGFSDFE